MFEKVLVPIFINDAEKVKTAVDAARLLVSGKGEITLLNIVEEIPTYIDTYVVTEALDGQVAKAQEKLDEIATSLGTDLKTKVVKGHAGRTILEEAEELKSDAIVVSSHRPGIADYFLGSTAGHVVRHAVCPVLVLR